MEFISTRGGMPPIPYSATLLEGLAPDGGLAVPESIPQLRLQDIESWRALNYAELACEVLSYFATDIPGRDLAIMCENAYGQPNFPAEPVPLREISPGISLLGLSEGPTLAFKDMAMQFLGEALQYVLAAHGGTLNVLGATSGDTGSAAEYALRGKRGICVFMLSPAGRMSDFQRAQMYSLHDENIHNISVAGVFDDCQNLVKQLSGELEFKHQHSLGTVNSINLGRISAQVVYYFWAWLRASDGLSAAERQQFQISVTVPSGNFGNILSGQLARRMGLPLHRLVLAANENNVLDEFFRSGIYAPRNAAQTHATSSPSMDISKASNLERFIFDLLGRDPQRLKSAWAELDAHGKIDLRAEQPRFTSEFGFLSGTSTHADRLATIAAVYRDSGEIVDPHTADGVKVAREHLTPGVPMIVLETAKAAKFPEIVREAIGVTPPIPSHLAGLLDLPQQVVSMADDAAALREYIARHAV